MSPQREEEGMILPRRERDIQLQRIGHLEVRRRRRRMRKKQVIHQIMTTFVVSVPQFLAERLLEDQKYPLLARDLSTLNMRKIDPEH